MKHLIFILGWLSIFSTFFAQNSPQNELLWEISHADLASPSYLYGTMHVRDTRAFQFSDSVLAKLHSCKTYAMEVHPDEMMAYFFENEEDLQEPFLQDVLSEEEFNILQNRFQTELNLSLEGIRVNQLSLLDEMIGEAPIDSLDKSTFLDAYLFELARGWGKKVVGLENLKDHMDLLDEAKETQVTPQEITDFLIWRLENQESPSYLGYMKNVYEDGDIETIEAWTKERYQQDAEGNSFDFDLINRNYVMADSIEKLAAIAPTFSAVGVAHLPGEEGVIELLRKKGFTVQPVKPTYTGLKDYYEGLPRESRIWETLRQDHAGYQVEMPVKSYKFSQHEYSDLLDMRMGVDMGSGLYFATMNVITPGVKDQNQLDTLFNNLTDQYLNNSDEFVNVDLLDSISLDYDGIKGRELQFSYGKLETAKVRMRMLHARDILYVLFAGGMAIDLNGEDMNRFFDSFELKPIVAKELKMVVNPDLAFQAKMPPSISEKVELKEMPSLEGPDNLARQHFYIAQDNATQTLSMVTVTLYPTAYYFYDDTVLLDQLVKNGIGRLGEDNFTHDTTFLFQGSLTRRVAFNHPQIEDYKGWARYTIRGARVYITLSMFPGPEVPEKIQTFESSFSFLPLRQTPVDEWNTFKDSISGIKISIPITPPRIIANIPDDFFSTSYGLENIYDIDQVVTYASMDSSSSISYELLYQHASDYAQYEEPDSMLYWVIGSFAHEVDASFELYDTTEVKASEIPGFEVLGKFKRAKTHFRIRAYVKGRHIIKQVVLAPKEYLFTTSVNHFMNSLDLSETFGDGDPDPFSDKKELIFQDLFSSDTTKRSLARRALYNIEFEESDKPQLLAAFKAEYPEEPEGATATWAILGDHLGIHKESAIIPIIKERYDNYTNSPKLQGEWLEDLATLGTETAFQAFADLMTNPPQEKSYYLMRALNSSFDSGHADVFVPVAMGNLKNSYWGYDMMSFLMRADDSGLVSLDTSEVFKAVVFQYSKDQLDSIKQHFSAKDSIPHYGYYNKENKLVQALGYTGRGKAAAKIIQKFSKSKQAPLYLQGEAIQSCFRLGLEPLKSAMDSLTASSYWHIDLYHILSQNNRLDLLPAQLRSQEALGLSEAINYLQEGEPDATSFLGRREVSYKGKSGYVYCYSLEWKGDYQEKYMVFSGIYPKDESVLEINSEENVSDYYWVDDNDTFELEAYWEEYLNDLAKTEKANEE